MTKKLWLERTLARSTVRAGSTGVAGARRNGGSMSIWLAEPSALNIAIDARIETLRGRRVRRFKSRLARRN